MMDTEYMRLAIHIADAGRGQTSPNPMVGCVLVKDGEIVGQGAHLKAGGPHAEVHALNMAKEAAKGATAYVTLEPCSHYGRTPPCADALVAAGVARVVVALLDPDARVAGSGVRRLRDAGIEVTIGVLADEAREQNRAFLTRVTRGRPLVHLKLAATLDGYVATETGHSQYVTGEAARAMVQRMRQELSSIAVGVKTVKADNPRLTVHEGGPQPMRIVFDSELSTPPDSRLLFEPGNTLIYCTPRARDESRQTLAALEGVEVVTLAAGVDGRVDLASALADVALRGHNSMLLEGGPRLASAFLREGLVDEVSYFIAPKFLLGGQSALTGLRLTTMDQALPLYDIRVTQVGQDICVEGRCRDATHFFKETDLPLEVR